MPARCIIERATDTAAIVLTAPSPAAPASHCALRACPSSSPLNGLGLAVSSGDAPSRAGHHLVVDGAEQICPVLRRGFAAGARPEQDRFVALGDVKLAGPKVDD